RFGALASHAEGHHDAPPHRRDSVHRPAAGRPLAEEQRERRRDERQEGDQPRVLHEPTSAARAGGNPLRSEQPYHLSRSTSSTLIVARFRKSRMTIASPMPTSAAATAITNNAKTSPVTS